MIDQELNITNPIKRFADILGSNKRGYCGLRRRAVLSHSNGSWKLCACTVEGIISSDNDAQLCTVKQYDQAILFEDWLTKQGCVDFIGQFKKRCLHFGDFTVQTTEENQNWRYRQVPLSNDQMYRAGYVLNACFDTNRAGMFGYALLAQDQPYYPDLAEAVRDWLPFPVYHGDSDGRNGYIVFLLPETRAFLCEAIPDGSRIGVRVAGTDVDKLSLMLKGAWWEDGSIHHIDVPVNKRQAELNIPVNVSRIEYVLVDTQNTVYDFQIENAYQHSGLGRKRLRNVDATSVSIVNEACRAGEGEKVEFKPFIEINSKRNSGTQGNKKLGEIIRTVVAFANSGGGCIFLGIDDNCGLIGIDSGLEKWAKASSDKVTCENYLGTLRGKIRDMVVGNFQIRCLQTFVDTRRVAIIEVFEAEEMPISIRQDSYLYIRRGASNVKVAPDEWRNIICPQSMNRF